MTAPVLSASGRYSWWDRLRWRLTAWKRAPQTAGWSLEKRDEVVDMLLNPVLACRVCCDFVRLNDLLDHYGTHYTKSEGA